MITGKVAGSTFQRTRAGSILSRAVLKRTNGTPDQRQHQRRFSKYSAMWRDLSQANRDAWTAWADGNPKIDDLGAVHHWTGHQAYLSCNYVADVLEQASLLDTPPGPQVWAPTPLRGDGLAEFYFVGGVFEEGMWKWYSRVSGYQNCLFIWDATPPYSAGKTNVKNMFKRIGTFETVDALVAGQDIEWMYYMTYSNTLGSLFTSNAMKISMRLRQFGAGQIGPPCYATATIRRVDT